MEGDRFRQSQLLPQYHFNPLPPHGGRHIPDAEDTKQNHFNPLPPHGGRRCILRRPSSNRGISIHSLRMEGDSLSISSVSAVSTFQSTPSAWRETDANTFAERSETHFNPLPPHGGRPINCNQQRLQGKHFNPLPPHGGRPLIQLATQLKEEFQSTPSAWRETQRRRNQHKKLQISIHSLRMEGDYSQPSI